MESDGSSRRRAKGESGGGERTALIVMLCKTIHNRPRMQSRIARLFLETLLAPAVETGLGNLLALINRTGARRLALEMEADAGRTGIGQLLILHGRSLRDSGQRGIRLEGGGHGVHMDLRKKQSRICATLFDLLTNREGKDDKGEDDFKQESMRLKSRSGIPDTRAKITRRITHR